MTHLFQSVDGQEGKEGFGTSHLLLPSPRCCDPRAPAPKCSGKAQGAVAVDSASYPVRSEVRIRNPVRCSVGY